jgi:hemerythrin
MSAEFCKRIQEQYLTPVDLKKVDIGGGMIHGQVKDYRTDQSKKIILAHTAIALTPEEKEVGSEASFATMDVLIPNHQNFSHKKAAETLQTYFQDLSIAQLHPLLNNKIEIINPGTIILGKGDRAVVVYLILSGIVECILREADTTISLSTGSFIGTSSCLKQTTSTTTYRTLSHVQVLKISTAVYQTFLKSNDLLDQVISNQDNIEFLRKTKLFGEGLSSLVQNRIAQHMELITFTPGPLSILEKPGLYLLKEGKVHIQNAQGQTVESLRVGDFFGDDMLLKSSSYINMIDITETLHAI